MVEKSQTNATNAAINLYKSAQDTFDKRNSVKNQTNAIGVVMNRPSRLDLDKPAHLVMMMMTLW